MKIAVTSQNRKTITGHAGKCRKFWIFEVDGRTVQDRSLLELPIEQSFHENPGDGPHPLDDIDVLISGGMGDNLHARLKRKGIDALVTPETNPEQAVMAYLQGQLETIAPETRDHRHGHHH
jgi:predicted Fe-Mo cluster-binding NifX family protein